MKAISLHQPWASLVILGAKRFETRSWQTEYRGPLAIHASRRFAPEAERLCFAEPFHGALKEFLATDHDREEPQNFFALPLGAVLGVVELVECLPVESLRFDHTNFATPGEANQELDYGDFRPGRWAWRLKVLQRFERPVPMAGRLGLWECDERLLPEWKP